MASSITSSIIHCPKCFNSLDPSEDGCYECGSEEEETTADTLTDKSLKAGPDISETRSIFQKSHREKVSNPVVPVQWMPCTITRKAPREREKSFFKIMDRIRIHEFYPKKLSWIDAVKLRGSHPGPGFAVIEKLMMSDYRATTVASAILCEEDGISNKAIPDGKVDLSKKFKKFATKTVDSKTRKGSSTVHPMDVMSAIHNCCDYILLQIIMEKQFVCRLSIPLICPDFQNQKFVFLLWSLRGIIPRIKCENEEQKEMPLVEIEQAFFAFMRIGRLSFSKSKLLNEILSSKHHNTFFHRDCEFGMSNRIDSEGTVESSWYFPDEGESRSFKHIFTILNLRGDAVSNTKQAVWLCKHSNLCFLMLELVCLKSKSYKELLKLCRNCQSKTVVCFVCKAYNESEEYEGDMSDCYKDLQTQVDVLNVLCNWNDERQLSSGEWKIEIGNVIDEYLKGTYDKSTLVVLSHTLSETEFLLDENYPLCKEASEKVKPFSDAIYLLDPSYRKLTGLPLQGHLWRRWGQLGKEQYRNTTPEEVLEKYIANKKSERNELRIRQFDLMKANQSNLCAYIYQILNESGENLFRQYFIGWIQIILNDWSRKTIPALQKLYYEKLRENRQKSTNNLNKNVQISCENKVIEMAEKLENASLGLEHIFREFGQMFEAVDNYVLTHKYMSVENTGRAALQFPSVVAHLILQGMPFEMMDGDAAFVPLTWVKAVFQAIKNIIDDKKLFILSVIGIQSSGKSTLLNTMFGLKFAVSAGRCTRGLYFQLIPVDKATMDVDYDYLLVIDTEGLRAPELLDASQVHDNELATLVIGLGDVTIVNAKGENIAEMNDVLQIVIHAMIRIKLVKPHLLEPSCLFVHQNVSAADAEDNLKREKEVLLTRLDKITVASAAEEKITHIQHFKDVIYFDENNYSYCMPDLWQGQPPMAPMNYSYSERVKKIKTLVTKTIPERFIHKTISSFVTKLSDLWEAILSENFVFSFKNSEEVKSFSSLDQAFVHLYWEFKEESLRLQVHCQNSVTSVSAENKLKEISPQLEKKISRELTEKNKALRIELKKFFDTHENKVILEKWRAQCDMNLENVCQEEQKRITSALHEHVKSRIKQLKTTSEASVFCRDKIVETATQDAQTLKERFKELSENELTKHFRSQWPEWLEKFQTKSDDTNTQKAIFLAFRTELYKCFPSHIDFLNEELLSNPLEIYDEYQFIHFMAIATKDDLAFNDENTFDKKECLSTVSSRLTDIVKAVKFYIQARFGEEFHSGQASHIVKLIKHFSQEIDEQKEQSGFTLRHKFLTAFAVKVSKCAINGIMKNVRHFQKENDPLAEIRKRKNDFLKLFINTYRNIAKEHSAADWLATDIAKWLHSVVSTKVGPLIVNAVLADESSGFDSKHSFMNRILTEIAEIRHFQNYQYYNDAQESFFRNEIQRYVESAMNAIASLEQHKSKLEVLIEEELQLYLSRIKAGLEQLSKATTFIDLNDYFTKLRKQLDAHSSDQTSEVGLLCDVGNLSFASTLEITNFENFTQLMLSKLPSIPSKIMSMFKFSAEGQQKSIYSNLQFVSGTDPVDILAEKVLGCMERCHFCKAPCKYAFRSHAGDHNALQHCPAGVIGFKSKKTNKLATHNCQSAVGSNMSFKNKDTGSAFVPYKDYRDYYPDWYIAPDRNMETSLFWKWFMVAFHDDLVSAFEANPTDIPNEWKEISWEEARKNLSESF